MVRENELTPFTFENGEQVLIRKVSPFTMLEAKDTVVKPRPPTQKVKYGDSEVEEPNVAHPDYVAALQEYNERLNRISRELMIKRGVVVHLDDEQKQEVQELREWWQEEYGVPLKGNDNYLYVTHFCIISDEDISTLVKAISGVSQPTPEEIEKSKESFPGDIPGA